MRETYRICNFLANCCDYTRKQYKAPISVSPEVYETSSKTGSGIRILYLPTGPIVTTHYSDITSPSVNLNLNLMRQRMGKKAKAMSAVAYGRPAGRSGKRAGGELYSDRGRGGMAPGRASQRPRRRVLGTLQYDVLRRRAPPGPVPATAERRREPAAGAREAGTRLLVLVPRPGA